MKRINQHQIYSDTNSMNKMIDQYNKIEEATVSTLDNYIEKYGKIPTLTDLKEEQAMMKRWPLKSMIDYKNIVTAISNLSKITMKVYMEDYKIKLKIMQQ